MRTTLTLVSSIALLLPALGASAQNLVENAEFDVDTSSWVAGSGASIMWDSADVDDSMNSGSVRVTNFVDCPNGVDCFGATSQCIPASPGDEDPSFGAFVFIEDQTDVTVQANVVLRYFDDASCAVSAGALFLEWSGPIDEWVDVSGTDDFAPEDFRAVRLELACGKEGPEALDVDCLFDAAYVVPEPGPRLAGAAALASLLLLAGGRGRAPLV